MAPGHRGRASDVRRTPGSCSPVASPERPARSRHVVRPHQQLRVDEMRDKAAGRDSGPRLLTRRIEYSRTNPLRLKERRRDSVVRAERRQAPTRLLVRFVTAELQLRLCRQRTMTVDKPVARNSSTHPRRSHRAEDAKASSERLSRSVCCDRIANPCKSGLGVRPCRSRIR